MQGKARFLYTIKFVGTGIPSLTIIINIFETLFTIASELHSNLGSRVLFLLVPPFGGSQAAI